MIPHQSARRDPTYDRELIEADPEWKLAFLLSEWDNDGAPIGWGRYRQIARMLQFHYTLRPRDLLEGPGDMNDAFVAQLLEIAARLARHGLTNTAILDLLRATLPNPTPKE